MLTKKIAISISCFFLFHWNLSAQSVTKVITTDNYKSYYSGQVRNPLYVTYRLKNGGGACDRSGFSFHNCGEDGANDDDYTGTIYDKGPLANAEDFASSCTLEKETFCYYNCLPQTVKYNRGIWKIWESKIRKLSQIKSLFIICGGVYSNHLLKPGHSVVFPDYCYKIVLDEAHSLTVSYCLWFPNDN